MNGYPIYLSANSLKLTIIFIAVRRYGASDLGWTSAGPELADQRTWFDFSDVNEAPGLWHAIMNSIGVRLKVNRNLLKCMTGEYGWSFEETVSHFIPNVPGIYLNAEILHDLTQSMVRQVGHYLHFTTFH